MSRRRYSGYHGRSGARNILRGIVCLLVIVLMLVLAGLIIGQRYLVYTDDGVRLELPFFHREQAQAPPDASVPVNIVQIPGTSTPTLDIPAGKPEPTELDSIPEENDVS